jgi:hypothetical protein
MIGGCACRVRWLAGSLVSLLVLVACFVGAPSTALASSCDQGTDTGIFGTTNNGVGAAQGDQGDILVHQPPPGACNPGDISSGATIHMHIGGATSNSFAEIGWVQQEDVGLPAHWLFWETRINGHGSGSNLFSSGCATPGTTTTFRVGLKSGTTQWAMSYACNGGGFTQIKLSGIMGEAFGDPRAEKFTHSNPVPTNQMDERYTNLKYRSGATFVGWGDVTCQDPGSSLLNNFHMTILSGDSYTIGDGSGYC